MTATEPTAARELLKEAIAAGFAVLWRPDVDASNNPYVVVELATTGWRASITWHTRGTGTYRMFHASEGPHSHKMRDTTLRSIRERVRAGA